MSDSINTTSPERAAEHARLQTLFEALISRGSPKCHNSEGSSPNSNRFSVSSTSSSNTDRPGQNANSTRPFALAPAEDTRLPSRQATEAEELGQPNESDVYQFTFKHMVHQLYGKESFMKAVQDMLERSKNEFRPLAEVEEEMATRAREQARERELGMGGLFLDPEPPRQWRRSKLPTTPVTPTKASMSKSRVQSPRSPSSPGATGTFRPPEAQARIVKKRVFNPSFAATGIDDAVSTPSNPPSPRDSLVYGTPTSPVTSGFVNSPLEVLAPPPSPTTPTFASNAQRGGRYMPRSDKPMLWPMRTSKDGMPPATGQDVVGPLSARSSSTSTQALTMVGA